MESFLQKQKKFSVILLLGSAFLGASYVRAAGGKFISADLRKLYNLFTITHPNLKREDREENENRISAIKNRFEAAVNELQGGKEISDTTLRGLVNQQDDLGNSIIHYAAVHGRNEWLTLFTQLDPNLALKNKQGKTALDLAKFAGQERAVSLLMATERVQADLNNTHHLFEEFGLSDLSPKNKLSPVERGILIKIELEHKDKTSPLRVISSDEVCKDEEPEEVNTEVTINNVVEAEFQRLKILFSGMLSEPFNPSPSSGSGKDNNFWQDHTDGSYH